MSYSLLTSLYFLCFLWLFLFLFRVRRPPPIPGTPVIGLLPNQRPSVNQPQHRPKQPQQTIGHRGNPNTLLRTPLQPLPVRRHGIIKRPDHNLDPFPPGLRVRRVHRRSSRGLVTFGEFDHLTERKRMSQKPLPVPASIGPSDDERTGFEAACFFWSVLVHDPMHLTAIAPTTQRL